MKLEYTPRALADLDAIADYLKPRSPLGAARVRASILQSLQNLQTLPRLGRRQTVQGVRKIAIRKYPYLIYYRVDRNTETISVLAVQHSARERDFIDN